MDRRGPIAQKKKEVIEKQKEKEGSSRDKDTIEKPNTHREQLAPTPLEATALRIFGQSAGNRRARSIGSAESWLASTDDGSLTGDNHEDAPGNPLQPKPAMSPLCGGKAGKGLNTIIRRRPNAAISIVHNPDEWIEIEVTVDSGACETVMPASMARGIEITTSLNSHGAEYEVANGQTIPNLGERRCLLMTLDAVAAKKITFQVADVHKPLLSISRCADMGFQCHLGREGGYMEDTMTGERIPLYRIDNLYVMKAWIKRDPDPIPKSEGTPFGRPE